MQNFYSQTRSGNERKNRTTARSALLPASFPEVHPQNVSHPRYSLQG